MKAFDRGEGFREEKIGESEISSLEKAVGEREGPGRVPCRPIDIFRTLEARDSTGENDGCDL